MLIKRRPLIPLGLVIVIAAIVVGVVLATGGSSTNATSSNDGVPGIVDKTASFSVINQNTTRIPCTPTAPDGKRYTVHGSLVAPASLIAGQKRSVVVALSGIIISGQRLWRVVWQGSHDLDYGLKLAERGQAVATVPLLGYYGAVTNSGPNGNQVCAAAESDVIHQVVQELRTGNYSYGGASHGPAFSAVTLMAFSIGGEYAKAEIYSFHDASGLILVGSSPPSYSTPLTRQLEASSIPDCRGQLRHKNANETGPPGYAASSIPIAQQVLFYDRDPRDNAVLATNAEASPCGIFTSGLAELKADAAGLPTINVPVLITYGQHDGLVGTAGGEPQLRQLTGTKDKSLMIFPGAGHAYFLERRAGHWADIIAGWLQARGL